MATNDKGTNLEPQVKRLLEVVRIVIDRKAKRVASQKAIIEIIKE